MPEGFEGLLVWQKAHGLRLFVHREVAKLMPPDEKWDLESQIRRSSKSTPRNIAEGYGRFYYPERIRFCHTARGSLCETEDCLVTAKDLGYIPAALYEKGRELAREVHRLLNGYIDYLKQKKPGRKEPGRTVRPRPAPPPDSQSPDSQLPDS